MSNRQKGLLEKKCSGSWWKVFMPEAYSLINSIHLPDIVIILFSTSILSALHFLLIPLLTWLSCSFSFLLPCHIFPSLPSSYSSSFLIFLIYPPHIHSLFPTLILLSFSTSLITLHLMPQILLSHLLYFAPSCALLFPLYSHLLILIKPL